MARSPQRSKSGDYNETRARQHELNTKRRGELAELAFTLKAARLNFGVSKPYGDSERYDVIVDARSLLPEVCHPETGQSTSKARRRSRSRDLTSASSADAVNEDITHVRHILRRVRKGKNTQPLDPTQVYLELLARHIDGGIIEMAHEADHAYAAGYMGARSVRTWQERMKLLEHLGFIETKRIGQRGRWVLIVHPVVVIEQLRAKQLVTPEWFDAYRSRQMETKEESYDERKKRIEEEQKAINPPPPYPPPNGSEVSKGTAP